MRLRHVRGTAELQLRNSSQLALHVLPQHPQHSCNMNHDLCLQFCPPSQPIVTTSTADTCCLCLEEYLDCFSTWVYSVRLVIVPLFTITMNVGLVCRFTPDISLTPLIILFGYQLNTYISTTYHPHHHCISLTPLTATKIHS